MVDIPLLKKAAEERLGKVTSTAVGRILVLAVLVGMGFGLGLGVLGVACLEVGEAKPGMKGLGALLTRLKVRPGARDRLRYVVSKGEVFFAPFRGGKGAGEAEDVAVAGEGVEAGAVPEVPDVDVNVDLGGLSGTRAGTLSTGGEVSRGSGGAVAAAAKGAAAREGAAPKFNESAGKLNAKSVKKGRVTRAAAATSTDRRATTNRGDFSRAMTPVMGPARSADPSSPASAAKSGLDFLLGGSGAPGGAAGAAAAAGAQAPSGGGGGGAGSSSGGGGGGPESEDAADPQTTMAAITSLMGKAQKETDKAKDEMLKAKILAAGGHLPQAAFHYDRAEKAKKKSKEYSDKARALTDSITQQYQAPPATTP